MSFQHQEYIVSKIKLKKGTLLTLPDDCMSLISGAAKLLANVLGKLPADKLPKVLGLVIKPEIILVLLNHSHQAARANLIKVRT